MYVLHTYYKQIYIFIMPTSSGIQNVFNQFAYKYICTAQSLLAISVAYKQKNLFYTCIETI